MSGVLVCADGCLIDASGCVGAQCGNHVLEGDEACDGTDLGGETCASLGRGSGTLACLENCSAFDVSDCLRIEGEACSENDACVEGICLDELGQGYPGGYCTRGCSDVACPGESVCVQLLLGDFCMSPCRHAEDCRGGYGCFDILGHGETYCLPHCEVDANCVSVGACNAWTGLCGDSVSGGDNGDACDTSLMCKGSCTFWPQAPEDGYCVSRCSTSTGFCPGGSICSDIYEGTRGALGLCLDGCLSHGDCREGFVCEDNPHGTGRICLPPG